MADQAAPSTTNATGSTLQAYTAYLPALMAATNAQIAPSEAYQLAAEQQYAPQQAALQTSLYGKYAPQLANIVNNLNNTNALAAANTTNNVLAGPGAQAAQSANDIAKAVNPAYFTSRDQTANTLSNLLSSFGSPGSLSEGEKAAAERGINAGNVATGNLGNDNALNTVANAMSFGNALNQKRAAVGSALNTASSLLPGLSNSTFNPVSVALGGSGETSPTASTQLANTQFTGVQPVGQNVQQLGNSFLGGITGLQNTGENINANRRDALDRFNQTWSSVLSFI